MTDYSDLQAALSDQLDRDDLTQTQFDRCVKLAETRFNRMLIIPEREQTATASVSSGRAALPADFWAMRAVYVAGQSVPELKQMSLAALVETYLGSSSSAGNIANYAVSGSELVFGPTPGSAVTVTLVYYKTIPALTSSNTSNWLSTAAFDLYLSGALAEAYLLFQDKDQAGIWDSRTQAKMAEVERAGRRKTIGAAPLVPRGTYRSIRGVRA